MEIFIKAFKAWFVQSVMLFNEKLKNHPNYQAFLGGFQKSYLESSTKAKILIEEKKRSRESGF